MSRFATVPAQALSDTRLSPRDITVMCAIGLHTDKAGWCFPSQKTLGTILGISRQAVQKSIRHLSACGYLQTEIRYQGARQTTNMMRVLLDAVMNPQVQRTVAPPATSEVAPPATSEVAPPATSEVAPLNVPSNVPSNAPIKGRESPASPAALPVQYPSPEAVGKLWHEILPNLPPVSKWTDVRVNHFKDRCREYPKSVDIEWWAGLFKFIGESNFLMGDNVRLWTCSLPWLLKDSENFAKVVEGQYSRNRRKVSDGHFNRHTA